MILKSLLELDLWQFEKLLPYEDKEIQHFVSGKKLKNGKLFNLSFKVGQAIEEVENNRNVLASSIGISIEKLIFPSQTHSNHMRIVDSTTKPSDLEDTDALITSEKGICIAVMSADCTPILLFDTENKVIAAIHAGWRGTVNKIVTNTLQKMKQVYNTKPEKVIAGIGPSICQEVYEVGEEVIDALNKSFEVTEGLIVYKGRKDKGYFNLWEANKRLLVMEGILSENIEVANICTYKEDKLFFSARRKEQLQGRFAAGIVLI